MKFQKGEIVYETLDGGYLPVRIVSPLIQTKQYVVQLVPRPGTFTYLDLSQGKRGYFTLHEESISRYH